MEFNGISDLFLEAPCIKVKDLNLDGLEPMDVNELRRPPREPLVCTYHTKLTQRTQT